MSTDLIPLGDVERMAATVAKSGMFGMETSEQAMALMLLCQAENLHPMIAVRDYCIIKGRPAKKAEAVLRSFLAAGGKVEWHSNTDALAEATFSHPQGGSVRISWDMARAQRAGLTGRDNYAKYPRQMLAARVIGEGCRRVWPASTGGVLVPEEAMAEARDVTEQGEVLPPERSTVVGKLKVAAAKLEAAEQPQAVEAPAVEAPAVEAPALELSPMTLADYIAGAADMAALEAFRDDVAATDARTTEGKAARRAYNARLSALTMDSLADEAKGAA